jgi:tRNA modification GTPase
MAVLMRAPKSYTREDVVEISCHGGRTAIRRALMRVLSLGVREAAGGEFTRRAFENGRIDLTQAEAVMSLISSGSQAAYRASMRQLEGGVSSFIKSCREDLLALLARIEAANDFPDEIDELTEASYGGAQAQEIARRLRTRADSKTAKIVREGVSVVLSGRPNVGKSSLMNALLGSERAIVTDIAGTTRDVLTERMTIGGILYTLSDTAGLRQTGDVVEAIGVQRAEDAVRQADVVLLLFDGASGLTDEDRRLLAERDERYIVVWNKSDIAEQCPDEIAPFAVRISARTGEGIDVLLALIEMKAGGSESSEEMLVEQRHIRLAHQAADCLERAADAMLCGMPLDMASVDLWDAIRFLGEITGEDATESLISEVFARFCVGK